MYYKFIDGMLIEAPINCELEDGTTIINFNLVAKDYGYKELQSEPKPSYNESYQAIQPTYVETETNIIENWQVVNIITLDEYKTIKLSKLENAYQKALQGDFQSIGYTFSYGDEAQKNFTKVTALFALKPEKVDTAWNTKSHGIILLTKEQYLQVVEDAENHEWFELGKLWNYKHKVDIAQSYEEVSAVVWE
jgi:hypothetical protein